MKHVRIWVWSLVGIQPGPTVLQATSAPVVLP